MKKEAMNEWKAEREKKRQKMQKKKKRRRKRGGRRRRGRKEEAEEEEEEKDAGFQCMQIKFTCIYLCESTALLITDITCKI